MPGERHPASGRGGLAGRWWRWGGSFGPGLETLPNTNAAKRAEEIRQDLDAVVAFSDGLESMQVRSPSTGGRSAPAPPSPSPAQPFTRLTGNAQYAVSISPTDPPLMVAGSLAQTLLGNLYGNINQWVPSFGPWYRTMSANAMQRRVFPKQLRGNLNFTNSVSPPGHQRRPLQHPGPGGSPPPWPGGHA